MLRFVPADKAESLAIAEVSLLGHEGQPRSQYAFKQSPAAAMQVLGKLKALSSLDVNHGFSLFPVNVNFQVVPGYDYGLRITPTAAGDFRIICNEFCGIGHHTMVGRVIVVDSAGNTVADKAASIEHGGAL